MKAGQTEVFKFTVDPVSDLGYLDGKGKTVLSSGEFHVLCGGKDLELDL